MPLPFIPIAIGLGIASLLGIKKGAKGFSNISEAKEIDKSSRTLYSRNQKKLESARCETNSAIEVLGQTKIDIFTKGSIAKFNSVASQINNIPDNEFDSVSQQSVPMKEMLHDIKNIQLNLLGIAGSIGGTAGAGALIGLGAFGGVGTLATASTGTAIATLHGVAATNATLAWLGGGTLASGGFGMVGGMAMIGGIVVAPTLLVGGLVISSKGEKALEQAKENRAKVQAYTNSVNSICNNLLLIKSAVDFARTSLVELDALFVSTISGLETILSTNDDYRTYSPEEKNYIKNCFIFYEQLKRIMNIKFLDENGTFISDSLENIIKTFS